MKNFKNWLLALMTAFMVLGVATACTDSDTDTDTDTEENQDTETEEGTEESAE